MITDYFEIVKNRCILFFFIAELSSFAWIIPKFLSLSKAHSGIFKKFIDYSNNSRQQLQVSMFL